MRPGEDCRFNENNWCVTHQGGHRHGVGCSVVRGDATALRLAVITLLDKWEYFDWSVQGFGVLRLYLPEPLPRAGQKPRSIGRLHIWDERLRYPNVSLIHNHSWDLKSTVVCGRLVNERFTVEDLIGEPYMRQRLLTGYQSKMVEPRPEPVRLLNQPREIYAAGDVYVQRAAEVHQTLAEDGTVTVMAREEDSGDGFADVFWRQGDEWGSAKPRPATADEVFMVTWRALKRLEAEL